MNYSLRPALLEDLKTVLTWVQTEELLKLWGGPSLPFPPESESIWSAVGASPENSFSLLDSSGRVIGFAQALPRDSSIHLARIIVSPALRGHGIGRILCQQLIQLAITKHHPNEITLKVYPNNTPAHSLYLSLGFVAMPEELGSDSIKMRFRPGPQLRSNPAASLWLKPI